LALLLCVVGFCIGRLMTQAPQKRKRHMRWYDEVPALGMAVDVMEHLPLNVRIIISQTVSRFITREGWKSRYKDGQLKQLGRDKILGLMKSKRRLRWYDQHPDIHQAFNEMYLLGYQECQLTSIRIIVSITQLTKEGLEWLTTDECARFVDEIFAHDTHTLIQKASQLGLNVKELFNAAPRKMETVSENEAPKSVQVPSTEKPAQTSTVVAADKVKEQEEPQEAQVANTVNQVSEDGERIRSLDSMPISLKHLSKK
jgi:hypothetical protein